LSRRNPNSGQMRLMQLGMNQDGEYYFRRCIGDDGYECDEFATYHFFEKGKEIIRKHGIYPTLVIPEEVYRELRDAEAIYPCSPRRSSSKKSLKARNDDKPKGYMRYIDRLEEQLRILSRPPSTPRPPANRVSRGGSDASATSLHLPSYNMTELKRRSGKEPASEEEIRALVEHFNGPVQGRLEHPRKLRNPGAR
jgi:hypothetical protein